MAMTPSENQAFKCPVCPNTYKRKCALNRHVRAYHKNPGQTFQCPECQSTYKSTDSLNRHVKTYHENPGQTFQCLECPRTYSNKDSLTFHVKVHHENPGLTFQCPECPTTCTRRDSLVYHVKTCHENPGETFQCPECPTTYTRRDSLMYHVKTCHENPGQTFQCPECPKSLSSKKELRRHQQWVHNKKEKLESSTHVCRVCQKRFLKSAHLKAHLRTHTGERVFCCWCDSMSFTRFSALCSHVRSVHTKERAFRCALCPKSFCLSWDLKGHQATHRNEQPFLCPGAGCGKKYKLKSGLRNHYKVSPKCNPMPRGFIEKFSCPMCSKSFKIISTLRGHINTHIEEHPNALPCYFCGKSFKSKGALQVHILIHSRERPNKCSECPKAFPTVSSLNRHQIVHRPYEEKFFCSSCEKDFRNKYSWKSHIKRHKLQRNLPCPLCPKKFSNQPGLRSHVRTHTREKYIQCPDCDMSFGTKSELKSHFSFKHPLRLT